MSQRQEQRRKEFKKGLDSDEARKKREETSVSIRKSKRDESLLKKRNVHSVTVNKNIDASIAQRVSCNL